MAFCLCAGEPGSADRNGASSQRPDTDAPFLAGLQSGLVGDQAHRVARFIKLLDEAVVSALQCNVAPLFSVSVRHLRHLQQASTLHGPTAQLTFMPVFQFLPLQCWPQLQHQHQHHQGNRATSQESQQRTRGISARHHDRVAQPEPQQSWPAI